MITIQRDKSYTDKLRSYKVLIDDKEVGEIKSGETKTFNIDEGRHSLQLKIDWCFSPKLQFDNAESSNEIFNCGSNLGGIKFLLFPLYTSIMRDHYIALQKN